MSMVKVSLKELLGSIRNVQVHTLSEYLEGIPVFIYFEVISRALSNTLNYLLHSSFTQWAYPIHLPAHQVNGSNPCSGEVVERMGRA